MAAITKKVMLGEDDANMQAVLRTLLEIEGYQVSSLFDKAIEGDPISRIKQDQPDVLLLDVHLRDKNGIDLLRQMRADPDLQDLRVIMASGMPLKDECLRAGANDFLLKPFMPDELLEKLKGSSRA